MEQRPVELVIFGQPHIIGSDVGHLGNPSDP